MHELALFAPSRIPPKEIRDRLRQEVNFGCPICRSPFLTFHHFDPLWEPEHRHYEPGMIALCAEHHNFADGGNYSKDQLHNLKSNPPNTPPKGLLPWNSPSFFVMFGGNYYVIAPGKRFSFRVMGDEVFSFSQTSDKLFALNATIWNRHRNIVAKIEENDILVDCKLIRNLSCTAQAKEITISSLENETQISFRFDRKGISYLSNKIKREWPIAFSSRLKADKHGKILTFLRSVLDQDNLCPVIGVEADVFSQHIPIRTTRRGIVADFRPIGLDKLVMTGGDVGQGAERFVYGSAQKELLHLGSE